MAEATLADLVTRNRARAEGSVERELMRARHQAFLNADRTPVPEPSRKATGALSVDPKLRLPVAQGLPPAEVIRDAIEGHGSLIVRGLIDKARAEELRTTADTALRARQAALTEKATDPDWYSEFEPVPSRSARDFTSFAGMLAADSPRGHFHLSEVLQDCGAIDIATGYFGTRPVLSVEKTVFRRVEPAQFATWHQDGAFLGEHIHTLDIWIALTRCGRTAPGLEIFPTRVDRVLPTGAAFDWDLDDAVLEAHYPSVTSVMPEFDVGDGIVFDQLCVHRSGYLPNMTETRFAVECWLFAPASVPPDYTGLFL